MKKFLVFMLAMLWMSVAAFSQITTEKAIKGEIKEVSEYASLQN